MKQYQCNNCGAGHRLYYMVEKISGKMKTPFREFHKSKLGLYCKESQFPKQCPSCFSEDIEEVQETNNN